MVAAKNMATMDFSGFKHIKLCDAAKNVMQLTTKMKCSKQKLLDEIESSPGETKAKIGAFLRKRARGSENGFEEEFLQEVSKDKLLCLYKDFYTATAAHAFLMHICGVCGREMLESEAKVIEVEIHSMPNKA